MAHLFTLVVVGVTVGAFILGLTRSFHPMRAARDTGRIGGYFEHTEDRPLDERPDGNLNDPPIPVRPLRARA